MSLDSIRVHHWLCLFAALAISQLLITSTTFAQRKPFECTSRRMVALNIGISAYILTGIPLLQSTHPVVFFVLNLAAISTPAIFWLLTRDLFQPQSNTQAPIVATILIGIYLTLRIIGISVLDDQLLLQPIILTIFSYLPQLIMIGLVSHACLTALQQIQCKNHDAAANSPKSHIIFILTLGGLQFIIVSTSTLDMRSDLVRTVYFICIFLAVFTFNTRLLKLEPALAHLFIHGNTVKSPATLEKNTNSSTNESLRPYEKDTCTPDLD